MFFQSTHVSERALSAFLDGRLAMPARDRVARHLDACPGCREAEQELRALRSALRELPQVRAPRSFALREADVRATPARRTGGLLVQAMPLLTGMTALALFAFMALLSIDLFAGSSSTKRLTSAARPAAYEDRSAGAPQATAPAAAAGAQAATVTANTYKDSLRETAAFEANSLATAPLGVIERLTATVSAEETPADGTATLAAPSEAPPLSGLSSPSTALDQTEALAPTLTPLPTTPAGPTISPAAPDNGTDSAGLATARKDAESAAPTLPALVTRTPVPTAVTNAAGTASSDDTGIRAGEAALAAVALVSGGGLFFAWRRRT